MKKIKTSEFDKKFDAGEDVSEWLDFGKASRPNLNPQRVNVDFPAWMVRSLDHAAARRGITRQSLIKVWIDERLAQESTSRS
jgi:hypothetical protein